MMHRFPLALALGAALLAGCGEANRVTSPRLTPDSYVLVRVAGQPMPVTIPIGDNATLEIVADTMEFGTDGRGTDIFVGRLTHPNQSAGDPVREERIFQYRVNGDVIEIDFPCGDQLAGSTALCVAPPHYRGSTNSIQINFDLALSFPTPLLFQRLGIPE
jgi:hypothetical protein